MKGKKPLLQFAVIVAVLTAKINFCLRFFCPPLPLFLGYCCPPAAIATGGY